MARRSAARGEVDKAPVERTRALADLAMAREIEANEPKARVVNGAEAKVFLLQPRQAIVHHYRRPAGDPVSV